LLQETSPASMHQALSNSKISTNTKHQIIITFSYLHLAQFHAMHCILTNAIDVHCCFQWKALRISIQKSTEKKHEAGGIHNHNQAQPQCCPTIIRRPGLCISNLRTTRHIPAINRRKSSSGNKLITNLTMSPVKKGLSFISNRQRQNEGTFCASGLAGIEPTPPAPEGRACAPFAN
jgi:hypothetical protein